MRIATEMKYSHFRNLTPRAALLLLRQSRIMFIVCVTAPGIALLLRVGRGNNFPMLPSRFLVIGRLLFTSWVSKISMSIVS